MFNGIIEIIIAILLVLGTMIGSIVVALFLSQIIIDKRRKNNKFLEKKDKEQLEYYIKQDYLELIAKNKDDYGDIDYFYLEDIVADIVDLCFTVLEGQKNLYKTQEEVLEKEFQDFMKDINNKELNNIYSEMKKIKKIVFKYYNDEGILKMKF